MLNKRSLFLACVALVFAAGIQRSSAQGNSTDVEVECPVAEQLSNATFSGVNAFCSKLKNFLKRPRPASHSSDPSALTAAVYSSLLLAQHLSVSLLMPVSSCNRQMCQEHALRNHEQILGYVSLLLW